MIIKSSRRHSKNINRPRQWSAVLLGSVVLGSGFSATAAPVLEEVVVTAQKRSESLQDVPVAVSALAGDALSNTGFRDVGDIAAQVPSLMVTSNASPMNTSFRIRRIGNEGNIPTFEPDTALIIDGAFRSRSGLGLGDMVDVQSVEVLKGPQSTLYGKNAGAGVVSITTQGPSNEFESMLEINAGSDGYRAYKGMVNLPLTDAVALRLSATSTERDPLVDNLVGGDFDNQDGLGLRAQLRVDLTEALTARLILGRVERDMNPVQGDVFYSAEQRTIVQNAGFSITNNDSEDRVVEHDDRTHFDQTADDAVLNFEYLGDGYTLTAITGYEDYDVVIDMRGVEQLPMDIVNFRDAQAGESYSQELRLASDGDGDLRWLLGAFYYHNEFTRGDAAHDEFVLGPNIDIYGNAVAAAALGIPGTVPLPALGTAGDAGNFLVEQDTRSLGLFGKTDYRLSENLELALGLRYSEEKKTGSIVQTARLSALGCVPPLNANLICSVSPDGNNFDDSDSWNAVTGNINLSYFFGDTSMAYILYSQGFKAGGYSLQNGAAAPSIRPFDQEDIVNIEMGLKTELWDRRARINAAAFHTVYEDFQNASFVGLVFAVNNAERVEVDGIEVDSTWLLTESLSLDLNLAYIDASYEKYTGGQCFYGRTPDNALGQCDMSGETLPYAPKLTGNTALQFEYPLLAGDFYSRLDLRYTGEANYSSELDPRHEESSYFTTNLRLGWRNAQYDVALWGKNLGDEVIYVQHAAANVITAADRAVGAGQGSYQTFLGEPRTYGVTLRAFF